MTNESPVDAKVPVLGVLEPVDLRGVWQHEALNFTPWLASNLSLLADALGLGSLQLIGTEQKVGPFSIDILAETLDGAKVVIENQLESSDHSHLGQCITYAAGVDAGLVVWVLPRLLDEHRAALDWLNERTNEQTYFFGVVVSAVRIGDSTPAPVFSIEVRPNDWQKQARNAAAGSGRVWRGWEAAHQALARVLPGEWTTVQDLAAVSGTTPGWMGRHMYTEQPHDTIHRMMAKDGTPWQYLNNADGTRRSADAVRAQLVGEGVKFDDAGRADPTQRVDAAELEARLEA
jgi:hypothetical protein